ncbi:small nuclear ribonucleoprotein Sm D-like protein isoform X2 [Nilaparvata lugens]|uniref:small nuclear ribonucleoprotein Sm D-like protein isoform X2 n=1 Tax=Nilaparvata lugens TaxID=108931 RepID=UPI00193DC08A|nr:small nuclear ribonucleoprotein Sm D-like protein isoform X2 [Nilaparvata lugens]
MAKWSEPNIGSTAAVPEDTELSKVASKVQESQSNQPSTSSAGPSTASTTGEEKEEKPPEETKGGKMTIVKRKKLKNVLTRMENMTKGPLSKLKFCMDQRRRVKIVTRTGHGVRGTLEGFVEAFDKQWNVALRDVHEVWAASKTNKAKAPPAVEGKELSPSDAAFRREMFGIKVPRASYVNSTKKRVTLERHIDQLLVRGEQIVLIIV